MWPSQVRQGLQSLERFYLTHRFQVNSLAIIAASAFFVRYLVLFGNPAPPGSDYGNYLTNLHAFEGNDITGGGIQYPFVFIGFLWVVETAFGELPGLLIMGPLLAALVSIPSYLLLRNFAKPLFALIGSAALTFGEWASEMIGWGGVPNLLGIIFGTFFMAFLAMYLRHGRRRDLVLAALAMALTAGSHQISIVVFAVAAILAILIARAASPKAEFVPRGARVLVAGLVCSLPFAPFYVGFAAASSGVPIFTPTPITLHDVFFIFDWFFRESLVVWVPLTAAAVVGYHRLLRSDPTSFAVGVSLVLSPLLLMETVMSQHPVRPIYFLPVGIVPGAVAYLQSTADHLRSTPALAPGPAASRSILLAVVLATALALVPTSQSRMAQAAQFYTVATPALLDILNWIHANTPQAALVATSGPSQYGQEANTGCDWGWWVEGYAERVSLCTEDVQNLAYESQVTRSLEANHAFAGVVSFENGWVRVGDFAPYGTRGNPIISGDFGLGYEALVYFDDAGVVVQWWDSGTGSLHTASAHDLLLQTSVRQSNGTVMFQSLGVGQGISILREVTLAPGSAVVWNNYSFQVAGNLSQVSVSVFGTSSSTLNDFDTKTVTLSIGSASGFRENAAGFVQARQGTQAFEYANFSTNPESNMPHVGFIFGPSGSLFNLSFEVNANVDRALPVAGAQLYTAKQVLVSAGAGYVLVDKTRLRDYEWIAADHSDFRVAYQNAEIALFEVV